MTRFFVTGASGFIGQHLLPRLKQLGPVKVLVHGGAAPMRGSASGVAGDVVRPSTIRLGNANVVYHMAAMSFVPECVAKPAKAFAVNTGGTLNMLEAARKNDELERFVFMSTGYVYGKIQTVPIDEEHPREPGTPYGATKLAAEALVRAYHETYGLPTVIIRAFNIYGPGQSSSFLIPGIIDQLVQGKPAEVVDLRPIRDFTYISDFVELLLKVGTHRLAVGQTFNAGFGKGYSVQQIANKLMRIADVPGKPRTKGGARRRAGEIPKLVVDNRKAQKMLGWRPRVSLDRGLRLTWQNRVRA